MTYRRLDVQPIAGALGAEVRGVDLSGELDNEAMADIHQAFLDHLVIFFRDQNLTPDSQKAFARRFGPIYAHPMVQGLDGHPEVVEVVREPGERLNWGSNWHADTTFIERPPLGSVLYAREVPAYGSDTMWANMYLAYETLSDGLKRTLEGLRAVHGSGSTARFTERYKGMRSTGKGDFEAVHPVVPAHPETGRRFLYVNRSFTMRFEDMTAEESRPLLDQLFTHSERPEFTCRFRWRPGSVAFWDNRVTQHNAIADYFPDRPELFEARRVMHRVTIEGAPPA